MQTSRSQRASLPRSQDGLTLIEVMVALLILGIILSGFAASLISFSRATVVNESRVRATATLTALQETAQSLPWNRLALYSEEVDLLLGLSEFADFEVVTGTAPTLVRSGVASETIVTIPGPINTACPSSDPNCGRVEFVPQARFDTVIDGREYTIFQVVTETAQRVEDGSEPVRRIINVASWSVLGRTYTEVFESLRAPTPSERRVAEIPDVRLFMFSPRRVVLEERPDPPDCVDGVDADGVVDDPCPVVQVNRDAIRLFARTQVGVTGSFIELDLPVLGCTADGDVSAAGIVRLDEEIAFAGGGPQGWSGEISGGDCVFPDPGEDVVSLRSILRFDAVITEPEELTVQDVEYEFPFRISAGSPGETSTTVTIDAEPVSDVVLYEGDGGDLRFCADLEVRGRVTGADPRVSANAFFAGTQSQSRLGTIDADTGDFVIGWQKDQVSPWQIGLGESFTDALFVVGTAGETNQDSAYEMSQVLTLSRVDNENEC